MGSRFFPPIMLLLVALAGCRSDRETGPTMLPGKDCVECHTREIRAPKLTAAGTAYMDHQGTKPAVGARVTVTDAKGKKVRMTTNEVGNFFTTKRLFYPVTAKIELDGTVREMKSKQPHGACNHCHTLPPRNSAPGRISATRPERPGEQDRRKTDKLRREDPDG